ncbi:MAG: ABC transporter [Oscillospiraceae bacterium]|jgi:ABC-2 type transport system permease protein|nr:ABC transporter [Oscillospiraceae bacterium]
MIAVFKREFAAYFVTPLGYAFIGVYLLCSGAFFYMFTLTSGTASVGSVDVSVMFTLMFFVLMVTVPVLTMRLLSEEKKNKTDQLTLTAPLSLFGLVMGKFAAAFSIFLISTAVMPIYGLILARFSPEHFRWAVIWGNVLGLIMLGAVYVSVGLFVSSLTENQMIAAIVSILLNIAFLLSSVAAAYVKTGFVSYALTEISLLDRYTEFTVGIFRFSNMLFFISLTAIFIFLTVRMLERKRWN